MKNMNTFLERIKMILLTISPNDYEEIINGLETVISDRCGSEKERRDVQGIINRIEASKVDDADNPDT